MTQDDTPEKLHELLGRAVSAAEQAKEAHAITLFLLYQIANGEEDLADYEFETNAWSRKGGDEISPLPAELGHDAN